MPAALLLRKHKMFKYLGQLLVYLKDKIDTKWNNTCTESAISVPQDVTSLA